VTEIGLLLATHLCGWVAAVALLRVFAFAPPLADLRRVAAAASRAANAFYSSLLARLAVGVMTLGLALGGAHVVLGSASSRMGALESSFWYSTFLVWGGFAALAASWIGSHACRGAALASLRFAPRSVDGALTAVLRASGAAALLIDTTSVLAAGLPFVLVFVMKGGPTQASPELLSVLLPALTAYAAGVCVVSLVLQRSSSVFHAAADAGADVGGQGGAALPHDDPQNPALLAELVGDQLAGGGRCVDAFASAVLVNLTAALVAAALAPQSGTSLGIVALPIVLRAFGPIVLGFSLFVVRTEEHHDPSRALLRGQLTAGVLALGALVGGAVWLAGSAWPFFAGAGASALLALTAGVFVSGRGLPRRGARAREFAESERQGSASLVARAFGDALLSLGPTCALLGLALGAAAFVAHLSGVEHGAVVGLLLAVALFSLLAPYWLTLSVSAAALDSARAMARLAAPAPAGEDLLARVEEGAARAAGFARPALLVLGAAVALAAFEPLWVVPSVSAAEAGTAAGVPSAVLLPTLLASAGLGLGVVLAYSGSVLLTTAQGARRMVAEVTRQLTGLSSEPSGLREDTTLSGPLSLSPQSGPPGSAAARTPSYRACLDVAIASAQAKPLVEPLLAVGSPVLLGTGLALMYRKVAPGAAMEGVVVFVVVAALAGLAAATGGERVRLVLATVRRAARSRGPLAAVGPALFAGSGGVGAGPGSPGPGSPGAGSPGAGRPALGGPAADSPGTGGAGSIGFGSTMAEPRGADPRGAESATSLNADVLADVVGNSAGPAANVFVRAVVAIALAIAPFLH
jgi:K(+)-stimulated pyrophosphate-energized sodium pump